MPASRREQMMLIDLWKAVKMEVSHFNSVVDGLLTSLGTKTPPSQVIHELVKRKLLL